MRDRRHVSAWLFVLLRPFFRYSRTRDAYVLRLVGNSSGPVIRRAGHVPAKAATAEPTGRFSRDPSVRQEPTARAGSPR